MTEVLRKVSRSLRADGLLLIIQPSLEDPIVEVEIDGKVEFREVTNEHHEPALSRRARRVRGLLWG